MISHHLGFRVAYDGKKYAGFQIQARHRTIQAEIERALSTFFRHKIKIEFSSRTDAGVHAFDQWICIRHGFKYFEQISASQKARCLHSLNALLPDDIALWQLLKLKPEFHPKKSIQWKEYEYVVAMGPTLDPNIRDRAWWVRASLDIVGMREALKQLEGEHDFAAFQTRSKSFRGSTVRRLYRARLKVNSSLVPSLRILRFQFRGSGFLQHMVRNLVGTLVDLGRGRRDEVKETLGSKDRRNAGVNAPSGALTLLRSAVPKRLFQIVQ